VAETLAVDLAAPLATRRFHASALSVGQARRFLLAKLPAAWGDDADDLVLMLSELATNAVQHAATEFEVAVRVSPDRGRVRVEVSDVAAGYPTPLEPALDALHGRGLHIVRSLADAWGIEARRDRPGKTVWFSVVLPAPAAAAAAAATSSTWTRDAW
jgi:anti-sigma regulatory factor (Ser/Thr protein kinase)